MAGRATLFPWFDWVTYFKLEKTRYILDFYP
jgi:hypothetical protein